MVILLTGASRGIGAALVQSFTEEGHRVLMLSRNRSRLEEVADSCNKRAQRNLAVAIPFDLVDLHNLEEELISNIRKHTDTIDVLINNAGQLIRKPFEKVDINSARRLFETNFFAPAQLIRICIPLMKGSRLKHIVNVTSMGGFQGSGKFSGLSYYSASKAALGNLTECLAEEFRQDKVKVNALAIGSVQTEMFAEAFPGFQAPLKPSQMAGFMKWFALEGQGYFNGKILPVSLATP